MNPLSPITSPASLRIVSHSDPFSFFMSCWLPGTGSDTKVICPARFVMISDPCPVVLYFPAHSSRSPAQDHEPKHDGWHMGTLVGTKIAGEALGARGRVGSQLSGSEP